MIRALTLASALMAASLSANTLAAQSTSTSPSNPAMHQAPAKTDTTAKTGTRTSAATNAAPAHRAAWTPAQVKEAQEGLARAGLYKGKATGVFNKETKRALRVYQKQNKLPVTGRLSDSTLAKLKAA